MFVKGTSEDIVFFFFGGGVDDDMFHWCLLVLLGDATATSKVG